MRREALRGHLTYSNVVATLALFIALGGASYAAINLPKNSVTKKQIAEDAVRASEVAPDSVDSGNLIDGGIEGSDIANGAVTGDDLATNSVGAAAVADNTLGPADLANNSIGPADLAAEEVAIGPTLATCVGATPWAIGGGGSAPGYWMDARRVVHLQGAVACPGDATEGGTIFSMPQAYRPQIQSTVVRFGVLGGGPALAQVAVITTPSGADLVYDAPNDSAVDNFVNLDGITYRANGPVP